MTEKGVGIQAGSGSSGSTMEAYCNDYAGLELQDDILPRHGPLEEASSGNSRHLGNGEAAPRGGGCGSAEAFALIF